MQGFWIALMPLATLRERAATLMDARILDCDRSIQTLNPAVVNPNPLDESGGRSI